MEEIKNGEGKFIFCCGEEKRRKLIGKGKHIFAEEKKNKVVKGGNICRRNIYFCGGEGKEEKKWKWKYIFCQAEYFAFCNFSYLCHICHILVSTIILGMQESSGF